MGLPDGGLYEDILTKGQKAGLALCPLPLAMDLRLDWLDQPPGPYITLAAERAFEDDLKPCGLYLRRMDERVWLRGYRATRDYVWPPGSLFFFERP